MADLAPTTDPYLYYLISAGLAFNVWNALQNKKHCKLLTQMKTAIMMKFPELQRVFNG